MEVQIYKLTGVPVDVTAPTSPQVSASAINATGFSLIWLPSKDNVGVLGYEVFKDDVSLGTTKNKQMKITGLVCGTTYSITVKAYDYAGNYSNASTVKHVTTTDCGGDTQSPSIPVGLSTKTIKAESFILTWLPSTDDVAVSGYDIYKNGIFYASTADTSLLVSNLQSLTSYTLTVRANDAAGRVSDFCVPLICTTAEGIAPSIPEGFMADFIQKDGFTLHWNPSTDNTAVKGYDVYIGSTSIGNVNNPFIKILELGCGIEYGIKVRAYDEAGNFSELSPKFMVETSGCSSVTSIVKQEIWNNITGELIANIPVKSTPDELRTLSTLEIQADWADNYGSRIRGYILPSTFGDHTFYFSGDNYCELWLSTDSLLTNKVKIANVIGWTKSREWEKQPNQKSGIKKLTAGTRYYFEALMKEATGGDNLAIGWIQPGPSTISIIGPPNIDKYTDDFEAPSAPTGLDKTLVTSNTFVLKWLPATDNIGVVAYDVFKNGTFYGSTTDMVLLISGLLPSTAYSMTVKAKDAAGYLSDESEIIIVHTDFSSSVSTSLSNNLAIYPNPANSYFMIDKIINGTSIKVINAEGTAK